MFRDWYKTVSKNTVIETSLPNYLREKEVLNRNYSHSMMLRTGYINEQSKSELRCLITGINASIIELNIASGEDGMETFPLAKSIERLWLLGGGQTPPKFYRQKLITIRDILEEINETNERRVR